MIMQIINNKINYQERRHQDQQRLENGLTSNFNHFKELKHVLPPSGKLLSCLYFQIAYCLCNPFIIYYLGVLGFKSVQVLFFLNQIVTCSGTEQYFILISISRVAFQNQMFKTIFLLLYYIIDLLKYSNLDIHFSIRFFFLPEENYCLIILSRMWRQRGNSCKKAFVNKKTCVNHRN